MMRQLALAALVPLACAVPASQTDEVPRQTTQAIVRGVDSDASQDHVVLVMHYDALKTGGGAAGCTGILLTPKLVLTARHCVAETDESAACSADGVPIAGGVVRADHTPSKLYAFAGVTRPDYLSGLANASRGAEIITDGSKTMCNHDIALLLLEKPLSGAKIAAVRLDGGPVKGEAVTLVGWGITDKVSTPDIRQQRTGASVVLVGPSEGVGPAEFRVSEGGCAGDSGGPAFATSDAVLGVLSRGGKAGSERGDAQGCIDSDNTYTQVAGYRDLILSAYEKAGQEAWLEGQPNPRLAKTGVACAGDAECRSNRCDIRATACADDCSSSACPSGFVCEGGPDRRMCVATPDDEKGCSAAPRAPSGSVSAAAVLALALAWALSRRCIRSG